MRHERGKVEAWAALSHSCVLVVLCRLILQYTAAGTATARLTGYTGSKTGVNGCSGYSTCTQYR